MSTHPSGFVDGAVNDMLANLPSAEREQLLQAGRRVELKSGETLHRFGESTGRYIFPLHGMISLVMPTAEGHYVEVALVGREGVAGISRLLGQDGSDLEAIAQVSGEAIQVPVGAVKRTPDSVLNQLAERYAATLLIEIAQTAACNRLHSVEERTARWLLHAGDRAGTADLELTHDFMAMMLGVRRASVTVVVGIFNKAGLITSERGQISIADRDGLSEFACACYDVVRGATPKYD